MIDPIHQFNIDKIFTIGHIGNQEIAFTNSSAYMFGSVALISLLMIGGSAGRQLVPGRIQSVAELCYEFVADTIRATAGRGGMEFLLLVVAIGIISFLSRPSSHSVRLFANMLAGHITLKVFASFVTMLGAMGILGWAGAVLPLALTVALTALELLVAFLQAYVFTILTCIYINDAIHPGH